MRGEVAFWQGMFALAFYEEIFSKNVQTYNDIPSDLFSADFYPNRKEEIDKKNEYKKQYSLTLKVGFMVGVMLFIMVI